MGTVAEKVEVIAYELLAEDRTVSSPVFSSFPVVRADRKQRYMLTDAAL
jgi:hypothetical protein